MESILLQAFKGTNKHIPVWFMRQAGRFLPQYRKFKEKYSLGQMFKIPEVAAKITVLPVNVLEVDAAILFADILTLPAEMGFKIDFVEKKGPIVRNPIATIRGIQRLRDVEDIPHIQKTIALVKEVLPPHIPLIGFAGSPFTVFCYLVGRGAVTNFQNAIRFMYAQPTAFHRIMRCLTKNTIRYLQIQKKAGVDVYQLFDSWAGILTADEYKRCIFSYVQEIFTKVKLPSIYYIRNCAHLLEGMSHTKADFLSIGHDVDLRNNRILTSSEKGVQGNLFTGFLHASPDVLKREVRRVLQAGSSYSRYIFNLSSGITPDVPVSAVKAVVAQVHRFSRKRER